MLYIKLFIEREKNTGQSAPECPFKVTILFNVKKTRKWYKIELQLQWPTMRKSNNRYFYHIFVSPGDAPGAITLNVVCMEREFDAYKLSRCMWPSNYYRFWDTARYLWKNSHSTPPLGGFPSEYRHPLWDGKTRMVSLPDGENFRRYVYSFWRDPRTW